MKIHNFYLIGLVLASSALAEGPKVRIGDVPTDQDTSITIQKGAQSQLRDFEVVSGSEEVFSDPVPTNREALAGWKAACKEWKTEMRENNKENSVISLNCNSPTSTKDANGLTTFKSLGTYKVRVRIRTK